MKKILIIFLVILSTSACGKKGALKNPPDYARPDFNGVIGEN